MSVNVAAHTYSVYVTPPGGTQQALATNYAFRGEQAGATNLNDWVNYQDPGTAAPAQVCNFTLGAAPASSSTVAVSTSPASSSLLTGGTQQFTASVSGASNTGVTWSATSGTISSTGFYTAPGTPGTYTVTATSVADSTKTASATVLVGAAAVSVNPISATVASNGTQQFTATVTGAGNTGVTWSVSSGVGTISSSGLYTAPSTAGTATVMATSVADPRASAAAGIVVNAPSTALLSASPASLSFESLLGLVVSKTITLANIGNASVTVFSASTTGSGFNLVVVPFPFTLAAGASQTVTVTYLPLLSGSATGSISFVSSATNSPLTVSLGGSGTAAQPHSATLKWQAGSSTLAGYNIYRAPTSGGPYTRLNTVVDLGSSFVDSTVQPGQTYYYTVTAVSVAGDESGYSNQVQAIVPTP